MSQLFHARSCAVDAALLRIAVYGIWIVLAIGTPLQHVAELPSELWSARGLFRLVPIEWLVQRPELLIALRVLVVIGAASCLLGLRPFRPIAAATAVAVLLMHATMTGVGPYVNHAQIVPLFAALLLPFTPAVADRSLILPHLDRRRSGSDVLSHAFPLFAIGLVLAITYSFIGLRRFGRGQAELYLDDSVALYILARAQQYSAYAFEWGTLVESSSLVALLVTLGMLVSTCLEVLSPLALLQTWFRRLWIAFLLPFHAATLLMMNILFWENVILIIVVFTRALGTITHRLNAQSQRATSAGNSHSHT